MNQCASFGIRRGAGDRATPSLDCDRELLASRGSKPVDFFGTPDRKPAAALVFGLPQLRTRSVA